MLCHSTGLLLAALLQATDSEARVVEYLKANVVPGKPVVASDLYNTVFTSPEERKALDRLFNSFFKIPLFVAQFHRAQGRPPSLAEISEQFHFKVPGQAEVLLRIMDSDPRMPRFLERDPKTGEILRADLAAITSHPRFGKVLERTLAGWEGKPAPAFALPTYGGGTVGSSDLAGRPYAIYFWFTDCPPCMETSPRLADLHRKYSPSGFEVAAVNADRVLELPYTDEDRAAYVKKAGLGFIVGHLTEEMQRAYGAVSVFPTLFFVDRSGVIVRHFVNRQESAVLEEAIRRALE